VVGAVAALPADQRAVIVMRYLLEYTPGEIARMLSLPRGTVNSRLRRGLDALQSRIREEPA
jgi:RNA polymerase sigma-70 factor (ECF subfamily)